MTASSNFLIPNATLIVEVVAFLIVLGFLAKYVLPVLNKTLGERQQQIGAALEAAEKSRAEERGRVEYERLVSRAEAEIAGARQRAVEEVTTKVGALVISVARQVIGREIDESTHRALIDEAVTALRASVAGGPDN
jgi:F-type H+-transporting ATPase subunit b